MVIRKSVLDRAIEEVVLPPELSEFSVENVIKRLPQPIRQRGRILMSHLKWNNFAFSKQGEFIPFGCTEPIPGSHIDELLKFSLRKPHQKQIGPPGFSDFLMQLEYSNIPRGLISNHHYPNYKWSAPTEKMDQSDLKCQP